MVKKRSVVTDSLTIFLICCQQQKSVQESKSWNGSDLVALQYEDIQTFICEGWQSQM